MKLIKSVLQAAGSAVKSPDLIVSTGDVVRHHSNILTEKNRLYRMFEEVFSAILAVYDVGTTKTAFHLPLEIAQTYGNDDFENNYFFVSLQPNEAPLDIRKLTFATHNPRMPLPAVATVPLSL